jgi:hypothetical protein
MRHKSGTRGSGSEKIIRTIKRKTRRRYNAEDKIRIVLDGLRGEDSMTNPNPLHYFIDAVTTLRRLIVCLAPILCAIL